MTDPCDSIEDRLLAVLEPVAGAVPCVTADSEGDLPSTRCVAIADGAIEDDRRPGHWRVSCRVEVVVEAEEEQSVAGLEGVWAEALKAFRTPGLELRLSTVGKTVVHGFENFAIARTRTKREWSRALTFFAWATVLDP